MLTKSKTQVAIVAGVACLSLSTGASWGSTAASHAAKPHVHPLDTSSSAALLAQCRAEKRGGIAGGACDALSASQAGMDPRSTSALRALLQRCLAAKAGQAGAAPTACAALDQASGN